MATQRTAVEDDLRRLRRRRLSQAQEEDYQALAHALRAGGFLSQEDFRTAVETYLRALFRSYSENLHAQILMEIFLLDARTRSLSPTDALSAAVRRHRGSNTERDRDAFRKNEMDKAIQFAAELLERRELTVEARPSPAAESPLPLYEANYPAEWHVRYHAMDYVGPIWISVAFPEQRETEFDAVIIWGDFLFRLAQAAHGETVYLLHHKLKQDALPLYIGLQPPGIVAIGQGAPPGTEQINIDEGWVRIAGAPVRPGA